MLLWNYHDNDNIDAGSPVSLTIQGIPARSVVMTHYRIDQEHSNSYAAWKKMGSPASPSPAQIAELEKSGQLATLGRPQALQVRNQQLVIKMQLPRQAVSFIKLSY